MLPIVEQATRSTLEKLVLPTTTEINQRRIAAFKQRIHEAMAADDVEFFTRLMGEFLEESGAAPAEVCGALAKMVQGAQPFLLEEMAPMRDFDEERRRGPGKKRERSPRKLSAATEAGKRRFRIEVGDAHGVRPANIVGAILSEVPLEREDIGAIHIYGRFSTIDLNEKVGEEELKGIGRMRVFQQKLKIRPVVDGERTHPVVKRKHRKGKKA